MNDLIERLEKKASVFVSKDCKDAAQALREAERQIDSEYRLRTEYESELNRVTDRLLERDKRVAELENELVTALRDCNRMMKAVEITLHHVRNHRWESAICELEALKGRNDCEHEWLSVRQPLTQKPDKCVLCGMPRYQGRG